jgi:hypothetical protein
MANGMVYVAIDPGAERHDRQPNAMRRMLAGAGIRQPEANTNGMFIDAYGAAEGGTVTITVNHDDVERYLNALLNSKRFGFTPRRFWSRLRDAIIHRSLPDVAWGGEGLAVADRTLTESDADKASLTVGLRRSTRAQPINVEDGFPASPNGDHDEADEPSRCRSLTGARRVPRWLGGRFHHQRRAGRGPAIRGRSSDAHRRQDRSERTGKPGTATSMTIGCGTSPIPYRNGWIP